MTGTFTVAEGAAGPVAGESPFSQATRTVTAPFEFEGETVDEAFLYFDVTGAESRLLGVYGEGTFMGFEGEARLRNLPDGALQAVFPLTFGTSWSDSYTEEITADIVGFPFPIVLTEEVALDVVVDAWGTLVGPGAEGGVPALRLRVTTVRTDGDETSTTVSYQFVSTQPVAAVVFEDETAPTASFNTFGTVTTASEGEGLALALTLEAPRPNPARRTSRLVYALPAAGPAEVVVFDVLGREVRRLADGVHVAGTHTAVFQAGDLPAGLYVVRLTSGGQVAARTLTLVR